ncbi:MAG: hypothetical protein Kow0029_15320 [Candidatus Rifleibacteriota bacterium]
MGLVSFLLTLAAMSFAAISFTKPAMMLPAIVLFVLSTSLKAYQKGIIAELMAFVRLGAAFTIAWYFKMEAAKLLNLSGILSQIAGFYAVFLLSYPLLGQLVKILMQNHEPSMASKLLGAFTGGFEGLLLGALIFCAMTIIPGSQLAEHQPLFLKELIGSTEKIVAPILPEEATKAIQAAKTMSRLSKGVDPNKVDRLELAETLKPITELPEVKAIQSDPEFQKIVAQKDLKKILNHPKVMKLMESPELQKKFLQIDWQRLERALNSN